MAWSPASPTGPVVAHPLPSGTAFRALAWDLLSRMCYSQNPQVGLDHLHRMSEGPFSGKEEDREGP